MYLDAGADPILISATGVNPGTDRWPDVAHKGPIRSRPSSSAKRRHERRAGASREAAAARIRPITSNENKSSMEPARSPQEPPVYVSPQSREEQQLVKELQNITGLEAHVAQRRSHRRPARAPSSKRPRSRPLAAPTALRPSRAPQVPAIESTQADEANGSKKLSIPFSICACHPCAGAMLIFSVSLRGENG